MRLPFSVVAFFLLHSPRFVSARTELDGDLNREIPRATPEPLLYRDEFKHGAILLETKLGHEATRRDTTLGARAVCDPGYVLSCPATKTKLCCPEAHPLCCSNNSNMCCSIGSFCVGIYTCCYDGQVGCTSPEGCCPRGTKCCGIWCCTQGYECHSGECVASVEVKKHTTPTATAATTNDSTALVGGVIGGVLGASALVLCIILWRRYRGTPPSASDGQQPFFDRRPSSRPYSTNTRSLTGAPVTYHAQAGSLSQQIQLRESLLTVLDLITTLGQLVLSFILAAT